MHPKVDTFLDEVEKWQDELRQLRTIILDCGLTEEFKWRVPCYAYKNSNIVNIGGFKEYVALSFFKGALLQDTEKILHKPGDNVQSGRLIKFTSTKAIEAAETTIKAYIFEAIEVEKAGLKVERKKTEDYPVPDELREKMTKDSQFASAFKALTPGRQRGYLLHFAQPKQAKTRFARIEKYRSRIMNGQGMHDCVCGHSKRMPNCDGSHKLINQK